MRPKIGYERSRSIPQELDEEDFEILEKIMYPPYDENAIPLEEEFNIQDDLIISLSDEDEIPWVSGIDYFPF